MIDIICSIYRVDLKIEDFKPKYKFEYYIGDYL